MRTVLFILVALLVLVSGCASPRANQIGKALACDSVCNQEVADAFLAQAFPAGTMANRVEHIHFKGEMDVDVKFK